MTRHHQRLSGWTACGRSPDLYDHDSGTGEGVTCRACLRSLERRPAASLAVRLFCGWCSVATVAAHLGLTTREVEDEIRREM